MQEGERSGRRARRGDGRRAQLVVLPQIVRTHARWCRGRPFEMRPEDVEAGRLVEEDLGTLEDPAGAAPAATLEFAALAAQASHVATPKRHALEAPPRQVVRRVHVDGVLRKVAALLRLAVPVHARRPRVEQQPRAVRLDPAAIRVEERETWGRGGAVLHGVREFGGARGGHCAWSERAPRLRTRRLGANQLTSQVLTCAWAASQRPTVVRPWACVRPVGG